MQNVSCLMVSNACCVLADNLTYLEFGNMGQRKKKSQVYEQSESCVGCFADFRYIFFLL